VAEIEFYKKENRVFLLDPNEGFSRKELVFEVRKDPLIGHKSRILPFRRRRLSKTEISSEILEASKKGCPFCPDQISSSTPKLIPEIAPEGRIRKGRALLFPNSFPYTRYNWVVVFSEEHSLYLDQFSVEILRDGFLVAQDGIERVGREEPECEYSFINWNYLPQAGAGLLHPHLQIVVEDEPTVSHRRVLEGLKRYQMKEGSFYWEDFLSEEIRRGERYTGSLGDIHFLMAFSPLGILGEVLILFSHRPLIKKLTPKDWRDFSEGLTRVFRFFKTQHIESFNLAIFSGNDESVQSWVYARLCPRMTLPPWNTSDINYFEKLHDEVICVISPEEVCKELKPFFV
jgi:UDPglucose--hexose-1-phosphate uridylyltransferase